MRLRRLRDRLTALSAGLVLLVTLLTVLFVRVTTVEALRTVLEGSLAGAGRPFDQGQREARELLYLQAERLSGDNYFQRLRLEYLALVQSPEGTARHQAAQDTLRSLRLELRPLVQGEAEADPIADLLVLVALDGTVLVEHLAGRPDRDPAEARLDVPALAAVLEHGAYGVTYGMYPDPRGDLYLMATAPLYRGDYVDGALLLGRRLDDQEARQAAQALEGSVVYLAAGGRVLGASSGAASLEPTDPRREALARWLQSFDPGPVSRPRRKAVEDPPMQEADLGGTQFLVQPHPLWSEFDEHPVAWVLFTRDLEAIQRRVREQMTSLALIGGAGVLLALLLSGWTSGWVTRPIETLAGKMRRVGQGDLDEQAEEAGAEEVVQLASSFNQMTTGLRQKLVLEKYVPLGARREIEQNVEGRIELGGARARVTILFSDLRGFTSMSEKLEPGEVVAVLNEYLERMTRAIIDHQGDINEYIGDAILAVFHGPDGARNAVKAALLMQGELADLRSRREGTVIGELRMGLGLHTGDVVEGNIGTRDRLKYSVVGDTVNLAARIQDRSRDGKHTCILLSEASRADLGDGYELEAFGDVQFKGKSAPVRVWEVVAVR